ncbi:MAG: hypothetical protein J1F02_07895 [Lachnospiraceae bacterium]|nr:hypothetical protein [Lachnospiraceae bacterium]
MTRKLIQFINLNHTIKTIIDDSTVTLSPLFQFRLLGVMKKIEPHLANFEVVRNDKIREYGEEKEDGSLSIPAENKEAMEKFNEAMSQVLDGKVTIGIEPFTVEEVFEEGIKAEYLMGLYDIMEK